MRGRSPGHGPGHGPGHLAASTVDRHPAGRSPPRAHLTPTRPAPHQTCPPPAARAPDRRPQPTARRRPLERPFERPPAEVHTPLHRCKPSITGPGGGPSLTAAGSTGELGAGQRQCGPTRSMVRRPGIRCRTSALWSHRRRFLSLAHRRKPPGTPARRSPAAPTAVSVPTIGPLETGRRYNQNPSTAQQLPQQGRPNCRRRRARPSGPRQRPRTPPPGHCRSEGQASRPDGPLEDQLRAEPALYCWKDSFQSP